MNEKRTKEEAVVAIEEATEKKDKATELSRKNKRLFTDAQFERMVAETLKKHPFDNGYATRCYCRRCNTAWEVTERGVGMLKDQSPTGEIKISEGMTEQDLEDLSKLFFIIKPCFVCQEKEEKIQSEARLKTSVSLNNRRRIKS